MAEVLTAAQAAEVLGYNIDHLYRLLRVGQVKARQFNRVWLIDSEEVDRVKARQGRGGRLAKVRRQ